LIQPRLKAANEGKIHPEKEPMGIRRKDFYDLPATEKLLGPKFNSNVCHEVDGLIFQPVEGVSTLGFQHLHYFSALQSGTLQ
jgi:mRNA-capping enzyme